MFKLISLTKDRLDSPRKTGFFCVLNGRIQRSPQSALRERSTEVEAFYRNSMLKQMKIKYLHICFIDYTKQYQPGITDIILLN